MFRGHVVEGQRVTEWCEPEAGAYDYMPEKVVCVVYLRSPADHELWVPFEVHVVDDLGCEEFEFEVVAGELYYQGKGSEKKRGPTPNIGEGQRVWVDHEADVFAGRRKLTSEMLAELGAVEVQHASRPRPFAGAEEGETRWCDACNTRYLSDDAIECQICGSWEHADCMSHVEVDERDDGIYEGTMRWPYLFRGKTSDKIIPLPWHDPEWELEDDVCAACLAEFKDALAAQPLAAAWCEDREAMPDQDREALFELLRQHDFDPAQLEMPERDWLELREEAGAVP
jgi:hypothetical protein